MSLLRRIAGSLGFLLPAVFAPLALAADYIGTAYQTNELYRVSSTTGLTTLVGSYTVSGAGEFNIPVLARGNDGKLYGIASSVAASQIYRFDEHTAAAIPVSTIDSGPVAAHGAAVDPTSGLMYFTNTFGFVPFPQLYRVNINTGHATFLGNISASISDDQQGLAFTPNGKLYALNRSKNTLTLINKTTPGSSTAVGSLGATIDLSNGGGLFYDKGLQKLVAIEHSQGRLFSVDENTGLATLISGLAPVSPILIDMETQACGTTIEYGTPCPGSGGFTPHLAATGCAAAQATFGLELNNGLGGSSALVLFGVTQASIPLGLGCFVVVAPISPAILVVPLSGVGPGNGGFSLSATLPATTTGVTFTTQAICVDPGVPLGAAVSNGVFVTIS